MERRVLRGQDLHSLFDRFFAHAAAVLASGARIAWIMPVPAQSAPVAKYVDLERSMAARIEMGAFGERNVDTGAAIVGIDVRFAEGFSLHNLSTAR